MIASNGSRQAVLDARRLTEAKRDQLAESLANRRERRRRILDRLAVRGEQDVRLEGGELRARDDRRRLPLDAAVRPLRRRERPDHAVAVDEVAGERELAAVRFDDVGHRPGRVPGRRQREHVDPADARRPVLGDRARDRHRLEQREAVLPQVVVDVERTTQPVTRRVRDQLGVVRRRPARGCRRPRRGGGRRASRGGDASAGRR